MTGEGRAGDFKELGGREGLLRPDPIPRRLALIPPCFFNSFLSSLLPPLSTARSTRWSSASRRGTKGNGNSVAPSSPPCRTAHLLHSLPRAPVTKGHTLGGFCNRCALSHSSGGQKAKIRALAGFVLSQGPEEGPVVSSHLAFGGLLVTFAIPWLVEA